MTNVSTTMPEPCARTNNIIIGAFTAAVLVLAGLLTFSSFALA